jgi:hypothetical protein
MRIKEKNVFTFHGKRKLGGNVVKSVKVGGSDLVLCASPFFSSSKTTGSATKNITGTNNSFLG